MAIKNKMVVKSNRMIEASYKLTLIEQQIILYAICKAREEKKELDSDDLITIHANDFASIFNSNHVMAYAQLKKGINGLLKRLVLINDTYTKEGKKSKRKGGHPWLNTGTYVDGEGLIELSFNSKIIPYITRLEVEFTSYRLEKVGNMSSGHAIRLYELLVQHLSIGHREIDVLWLKETLQIKDQYKAIKDLKKWVIDVAVKQINEHSDIKIEYENRKTGRSVTHLLFKITPKNRKQSKKVTIDRKYIEKHALPGETYEQAEIRLRKALK